MPFEVSTVVIGFDYTFDAWSEWCAQVIVYLYTAFLFLCYQWFSFLMSIPGGQWLFVIPSLVYFYGVWVLAVGRLIRWLVVVSWKVLWKRTALGWFLELLVALWIGRAPLPPVLGVDDGTLGLPKSQLTPTELASRLYAEQDKLTHASVSSGGLTPTRCRRRAAWVCALQRELGGRAGVVGRLARGWWVPDLPSHKRSPIANALLGMCEGDMKLLGGGAVLNAKGVQQPYFVVESSHGREVIMPDLLGRLSRFAALRERDQTLFSGLRARAQEWCKAAELPEWVSAQVIPMAVARAVLRTPHESQALACLERSGNSTLLSGSF